MNEFNLTWKELKDFVKSHKFKTREEYWTYIKKNKIKIPLYPDANTSKFKNYWTNWPDFLESNSRKTHHRHWRSFTEAKKYVKSLNIKSSSQWQKYCKNNFVPLDIPISPYKAYEKQWKGWSDWLGNETARERKYLNYNQAKKWMKENGIKSNRQWNKVRKSKPKNMPSHPNSFYKDKGWKGSADFFDNNYGDKKLFVTYQQCKKIALKNKIKSQRQWQRWSRTKRRRNIPSDPEKYYKDEGWINWNSFLNTKTKPNKIKLTYNEAKQYVSKFNLRSGKEYKRFVTKNFDLEKNLPTTPEHVYKDKGWKGWEDYLNCKKFKFEDYNTAKKLVQKLGIKTKREYRIFHKKGKLPKLPVTPEVVYSRGRKND